MEKAESSYGKHSLFATAALLAPMTQAASAEGWLGVAVMAAVGFVLGRWCRYGSGWVLAVQRVWSCVIISVLMKWSTYFWEGLPFVSAVPFILLILGIWTVAVPGKVGRIGCVLLWPLILLLGAVLLSGVTEVKLPYLKPQWHLPEPFLLAMLLLPVAGRKGNWKVPAAAVLVSIITTGVLSPAVSERSVSGIYELSRSLSLLGMAERFESLVAAAMTMGFYLTLTSLLEVPGENLGTVWPYAAVSAVLYLIGPMENGWFLTAGSIIAWLVLPWLFSEKIFSKNGKKGIDKTSPPC